MCVRMDLEGSMFKKEKYNFRWVEFIAIEAFNQRFWIQHELQKISDSFSMNR